MMADVIDLEHVQKPFKFFNVAEFCASAWDGPTSNGQQQTYTHRATLASPIQFDDVLVQSSKGLAAG